ncbi:MAG: hypothetical protein WA941_16505 [Nitrososphaeraceae archaeon]
MVNNSLHFGIVRGIGVARGMNNIPKTKDSITLKDKAIFTAFVIILIVLIAILINSNYYNSIRDNLMSADFLIASVIPDLLLL